VTSIECRAFLKSDKITTTRRVGRALLRHLCCWDFIAIKIGLTCGEDSEVCFLFYNAMFWLYFWQCDYVLVTNQPIRWKVSCVGERMYYISATVYVLALFC
jgi:hypothetical protein